MSDFPLRTRAEIDLGALRSNVHTLSTRSPGFEIMGVVKANAYGHGAVSIAQELVACGVASLGVATVEEGIALRELGIDVPILVFGAPLVGDLEACARHLLGVTVSSLHVVSMIEDAGASLSVHVKIDTGMGRIGLDPGEVSAALVRLGRLPHIRLDGIWTHLATSDDPDNPFVQTQWDRFRAVLSDLGGAPAPIHVSNSGGLLSNPVGLEAGSVVRLGIALYGLYHLPDPDLRPVMRLVSRLTQVRRVTKGTPISYGLTWEAPRETVIGTVGAGYADGYPRSLSNIGHVGVGGVSVPVAGRVCMDMFMIDLGPDSEAAVGDDVVLFGAGGPSAVEVAKSADTIAYEIACRVAPRVTRVTINERSVN